MGCAQSSTAARNIRINVIEPSSVGDISQYSTASGRRRASCGPRSVASSSEDIRRSTLGSSSSLIQVESASHEGTLRTTIRDTLKRNHWERRKSEAASSLSLKKNRHVSISSSTGNHFLTVSTPSKADLLVKKTLPMIN